MTHVRINELSSVYVMAFHLLGTNPLPETTVDYFSFFFIQW